MKFAILADIHGNAFALKKVLEDIQQEGINQFIVLGDIVMIGPEPATVIGMIRDLNPLCWIKGNTDMWLEKFGDDREPVTPREKELYGFFSFAKTKLTNDEITLLKGLPIKMSLAIGSTMVLCVHGSPRSVSEIMDGRVPIKEMEQMVKGVEETIVLCGHSHVPYVGEVGGKHIFNVGSVGRPLDGNTSASYGILDISISDMPQFTIRRINYSVTDTIRLARELSLPSLDKYEYSLLNATLP